MSAVWATATAAVYWIVTRYRRGALVLGAAVFSHWILDLITHRPDLPLYPGSGTYAGLGLWNSVPATLIVEGVMFTAGVALYATGTRSKDRGGRFGFWTFVAFLVLIYVANIAASPPPNAQAVAIAGTAMILLVLWAWWFDRHRAARSVTTGGSHTR